MIDPRVPRTLALPVVVTLAVAGCCGKYKDQIAKQEQDLAALAGEKADLEIAKADLEKRIDDMAKYQAALEGELDKLGFDKNKLLSEFQSAQADLEKTLADLNSAMGDLEAKQKAERAGGEPPQAAQGGAAE